MPCRWNKAEPPAEVVNNDQAPVDTTSDTRKRSFQSMSARSEEIDILPG